MSPRSLEEVDRDVRQHSKDLYFGNGLPGLTTRVLVLEKSMRTIHFYGRSLLVTALGILLVAILDLVIKR